VWENAKDSPPMSLLSPMWSRKPAESDPQAEDRALVRRMRAGDEAAFEQFFEAYFHPLYRFALARLDQDVELAKEMTQATLCKALEKLATYRGEAALFSWLCSVCRFEISGHFRRARRLPPQVDLAEDGQPARGALESLAAGIDDPESALLRREVARRVHVTVDHLPPHYGQILEWKYSDGLSVKQIAERLGTSPKAAESLLTRARQAFRDGFAALQAET
jgi:RNA polymerase sigma-70 factor (ECF subfamily)